MFIFMVFIFHDRNTNLPVCIPPVTVDFAIRLDPVSDLHKACGVRGSKHCHGHVGWFPILGNGHPSISLGKLPCTI